jgi:hypothetical protein
VGLLLRVREQMRTEMGLRDIDFRGCDGVVIVGLEEDFRFAVCHESISGIKLDSQADINFIFFNIETSQLTTVWLRVTRITWRTILVMWREKS